MKKHNRTIEGMAIATNLDVEMFEIYRKKTTEILDQPESKWDVITRKGWIEGLVNIKLTKTVING